MIYEHLGFLIFAIVSTLITFIIVSINDVLIEEAYDIEKDSAYECGFQPLDFNLQQFDVKFYTVGLLFLIFDVEIVFILPFINVMQSINFYITLNFVFFVFIFVLGLLYEWRNKFLDWE